VAADVVRPPPPTPKEAPPRSAVWRTVGLTTAAVGLVGLGVGTVFALQAKSKLDDSNKQPGGCVGNACPSSAAATRNDARSAGNVATVFVIAGGVLAAAGVTMWFLAPSDGSPHGGALRVAPALGRNEGRLVLERAW